MLGEARQLFDAALASLELADGGPPGFDEGSTRTLTLAALAWLDWLTEGDEAALARAAQVAEHAAQARRPIISAYGFGFAAAVHQMTGDAAGAHAYALRCRQIAVARTIPYWMSMGDMLCGWSRVRSGQVVDGLVQLREGLAAYAATESEILRPYAMALLADAEHAAGEPARALATLEAATAAARAVGSLMFVPMLQHAAGRIAMDEGRDGALEMAYRLALEMDAHALARRCRATVEMA